ncbi:DUF4157 domain-containing protein [Chitinophaga horti]|uniref:DUF4157 domain-containing protein n=1 Tax=Chitinophaga horti TaxID=2920382 RepID=A0ABY6J5M1_9BACT|nr:DUF4157 domain-containing protein [Chitinophaga horti]UYQ93542.1 DUF4157 domain-containing protein [Chitinophaga horti]
MHQAPEPAKTASRQQEESLRNGSPFFSFDAPQPPLFFQTKLTVNEPGDEFEREADDVADKVMRMENVQVQRKCAECEQEEEQVHRSAEGATSIPAGMEASLAASRGGGRGLEPETRSFMERKFGAGFGDVRIHADGMSAGMNRQLQARAFAIGTDIYFNNNEYQPQTQSGKHLLAHELTHVLQQRNGLKQVSCFRYNAGTTANPVNIEIDYSFLDTTYFGHYDRGCEALYTQLTTRPATPVQAAIAALTPGQQRWLLFALDILIDNPLPGFNVTRAANALIAFAPQALYQPLDGTLSTTFENEVLRSSGWFERAFTRGLTAPTATEVAALDVLFNGTSSGGSAGSSSCPATRIAALNEVRLRADTPGLLTNYLATQVAAVSGASVASQNTSDVLPIADLVHQEALSFFSPYMGRGSSRHFLDNWRYSSHLQASTAPGAIPPDVRRAYIDNRATMEADANGLLAATNFDPRCAADVTVWDDIINTLDADPAVQTSVNTILAWQTFTAHGPTAADVTINLQYRTSASGGECGARWRTVNTLCHELMHVYHHQRFYNINNGRQIITEGFPEILGDQLFEHIRASANRSTAYRQRFEGGMATGACIGVSIPAAQTGYRQAGQHAEDVRVMMGDDRFRAAFFLGQFGLVGLQPKLEQGGADNVHEREADAMADRVVSFPSKTLV